MKRIIALIVCVLMIATLFVGCTKFTPENDLKNVQKAKELKIGYTLYEPMNYKEGDKLVGFDTEYAELVCKELGVEPKFIEIDWDSKEVLLNDYSIDCIWNGFTINAEREENLDFTTPYLRNEQVVVIRKADAEKYTDKASLKGVAVSAEKGSAGETAILEDKELKNASYIESAVQTDALLAVKALNAEACVVDLTVAQSMAGKGDYTDLMIVESIDLQDEEYGIGFRTNSSLTAKVNEITKKLTEDGTLEKLAKKYGVDDLLIK